MPLLFAAQQIFEGLLWLSLLRPDWAHWAPFARNAYLFFAEIVWPIFIPGVLLLMEDEPRRRSALRALFGLGLALGAFMIWVLAVKPVAANIRGHHIHYDIQYHATDVWAYGVPYFITTMAATAVSSYKSFRLLGACLLGAYLVSYYWYNHYTISVWCFFAALLSIVVIYILQVINRRTGEEHEFVLKPAPTFKNEK